MSFCRTETPFYDRPPVLVYAFWYRRYSTEGKGFYQIKIIKSSEAATGVVLYEKVFLKILQENVVSQSLQDKSKTTDMTISYW